MSKRTRVTRSSTSAAAPVSEEKVEPEVPKLPEVLRSLFLRPDAKAGNLSRLPATVMDMMCTYLDQFAVFACWGPTCTWTRDRTILSPACHPGAIRLTVNPPHINVYKTPCTIPIFVAQHLRTKTLVLTFSSRYPKYAGMSHATQAWIGRWVNQVFTALGLQASVTFLRTEVQFVPDPYYFCRMSGLETLEFTGIGIHTPNIKSLVAAMPKLQRLVTGATPVTDLTNVLRLRVHSLTSFVVKRHFHDDISDNFIFWDAVINHPTLTEVDVSVPITSSQMKVLVEDEKTRMNNLITLRVSLRGPSLDDDVGSAELEQAEAMQVHVMLPSIVHLTVIGQIGGNYRASIPVLGTPGNPLTTLKTAVFQNLNFVHHKEQFPGSLTQATCDGIMRLAGKQHSMTTLAIVWFPLEYGVAHSLFGQPGVVYANLTELSLAFEELDFPLGMFAATPNMQRFCGRLGRPYYSIKERFGRSDDTSLATAFHDSLPRWPSLVSLIILIDRRVIHGTDGRLGNGVKAEANALLALHEFRFATASRIHEIYPKTAGTPIICDINDDPQWIYIEAGDAKDPPWKDAMRVIEASDGEEDEEEPDEFEERDDGADDVYDGEEAYVPEGEEEEEEGSQRGGGGGGGDDESE